MTEFFIAAAILCIFALSMSIGGRIVRYQRRVEARDYSADDAADWAELGSVPADHDGSYTR